MNRSRHIISSGLPRGFAGFGEDLARRLYLAPAGMVSGAVAGAAVAAGAGWPIAGGSVVFTSCVVLLRDGDQIVETVAPFAEVLDWAAGEGEAVADHVSRLIHRIGGKRGKFAGLALDRPVVMGILNVTPDSFSDGGEAFDTAAAIARGREMLAAGADVIDVGGESTRPGAQPVAPEKEMRRVLPVVRALAGHGVVSIDTRHAVTMAAAVEAGAAIINDITALAGDPAALPLAALSGAAVILMHMQGEPRSMQHAPAYDFAALDVYDSLAERAAACREAGIAAERICLDPGIGFGKTLEHNLQILSRLGLYHGLGAPLLLGASRKSFVARIAGDSEPRQRLPGSLAAALAALDHGVQILRVHDVAETRQAVAVWQAIRAARV